MENRYLLYIDILGFSDLVEKGEKRIDDLYEVIASLNVHRHHAFKTIIFSDTILVYNLDGGEFQEDKYYLVMFLCEFAQDLQYRLTERGVFFRAVIVRGSFKHYELNSVPCFFGKALIDAYRSEKKIKAIGLFIEKSIEKDSDIFKVRSYNDNFSFVFITQSLHQIEYVYDGQFPIEASVIEQTDLIWYLTPEILYLKNLFYLNRFHPDERVREKYFSTWALFKSHYPKTIQHLENTHFDLEMVSPGACWSKVLKRFPEDYSWAIQTRLEY